MECKNLPKFTMKIASIGNLLGNIDEIIKMKVKALLRRHFLMLQPTTFGLTFSLTSRGQTWLLGH